MSDAKSVENTEDALERNLRRLRTEGLDAAVEAAIQILRDSKSPSQARSAAASSVFRATGMFDRPDDTEKLDPSEMDGAQLRRAVEKAEKDLASIAHRRSENTDDVFG